MRIEFKGRPLAVSQVQESLGLKPDGDDRRFTWQAIANALPLSPIPIIPQSLSIDFPGRSELVKRVQRTLGNILVDGYDGQETWSALAQRFSPRLPIVSPRLPESGSYTEKVRGRTPNRNAGTNECRGLVIHHASGYFEGTVDWCLKKGTNAAYHVLINTNGERAVLALDSDRCHHAGASSWKGRSGCNAFMLGLSFIGNTNDGSMRGDAGPNLTWDEVQSALEWIRPRMSKYGWTNNDITAHRFVSPGRKDDTSVSAFNQIIQAL